MDLYLKAGTKWKFHLTQSVSWGLRRSKKLSRLRPSFISFQTGASKLQVSLSLSCLQHHKCSSIQKTQEKFKNQFTHPTDSERLWMECSHWKLEVWRPDSFPLKGPNTPKQVDLPINTMWVFPTLQILIVRVPLQHPRQTLPFVFPLPKSSYL